MPIRPVGKSFTRRYNAIAREIITECQICAAFDPQAVPQAQWPPHRLYRAIWDTGATGSVISRQVVTDCGLAPTGMTNVTNVKTTEVSETFLVNIMLPNGVGFAQVTVTDGNLGKVDALIGMDIISRGDFSLTHNGGETVFSFRNPSIGATDFVKDDAKHNPKPIRPGFRQPPSGKHSGSK